MLSSLLPATARPVNRSAAQRPATSSLARGESTSFLGGSILLGAQRNVHTTVMAAKMIAVVKLALEAGKANPAPPVGPALGSKGVNIMAFCKEYNAKTADKAGTVIPVEITIFDDKSFTLKLKTPPASVLLMKAAKVPKGSGKPQATKVGKVTKAQITEIAKIKLPDLNCTSIESAERSVMGTAKNMGIDVVEA